VARSIKLSKIWALAGVAALTMSAATSTVQAAEGPAPVLWKVEDSRKLSQDVALTAGGELHGAVVRANGSGCSQAKVVLTRSGQEAQEVRTDAQGQFLFAAVRPGVYRLAISHDGVDTQKILRVWAKDMAPPAASPAAVVALSEVKSSEPARAADVARAQGHDCDTCGHGGFLGLDRNTLLIGGAIVGGAIAIPIIADDDDDDDDDVFLPPVVTTPSTP
jgi:hypothetical protein